MRICVDPGHGGVDPGAVGGTLQEKQLTLWISRYLRDALREWDHAVIMTRVEDRNVSLRQRVKTANDANCALFISVHVNAAGNPAAEGFEVFTFPESLVSQPYAKPVLRSLVKRFPDHLDRGVKQANFQVLREAKMPAILVECEFISNPAQRVFLANTDNQEQMAWAIARGIPIP